MLESININESILEKQDAKVLAFDFCDSQDSYDWPMRDTDNKWQATFCPNITSNNSDGTTVISPHPDYITEEMITYWEEQLKIESQASLIEKERYAGLLWDFYKYVLKKDPKINFAQIRIDSILKIVELNLERRDAVVIKLKQALKLAIRIKDETRISLVKDAILQYESNDIEAWEISYDFLIDQNKILSSKEKDETIKRMENRLEFFISKRLPDASEPVIVNYIKEISLRLAKYYRNKNNEESKIKALTKYASAVLQQAQFGNVMLVQSQLEEAYKIMNQFNQKDSMEKIALKLQEINSKLNDNLQMMSVSIEIPKEKIDEFISKMTEGSLEVCLDNIASGYFIKKKYIEQEIEILASKNPFQYKLCPIGILDNNGRRSAVVNTVDENLEGHLILHACKEIQINNGIFNLHDVINNVFNQKNVTVELLRQYFYKSPIFQLCDKDIFERSLMAYFCGDPLIFLHLIIPQIENMLRCLIEKNNQPVLKERRGGGFNLITFDELLRNNKILDEDISFYLRVVFTDQRGFNLRNNVCHGLSVMKEFSIEKADLVFHVLLMLAILK